MLQFPAQPQEQLQDLILDGDIERRGRLIGEEELGAGRKGNGNHHALAHAARELMRIGIEPRAAVGDADHAQELDGARPCRLAGEARLYSRLSSIWTPTVRTGLSAAIGSWKMPRSRAPRMLPQLGLRQSEEIRAAPQATSPSMPRAD